MREELRKSVEFNSFSPALFVNDGFLEYAILFDGSVSFDEEDNKSLFYQVKNHWQLETWLGKLQAPYIIWTGSCGPIFPLEEFNFSKSTIENFQQNNLTVILYEPMCLYRKDTTNTFVDHKNYDQFESTDENLSLMFSYELDSITTFAKKYNFKNKITVYTCNFRVKEYFQEKYDSLDLFCRDIFVSADSYTDDIYRNLFPTKVPHKKFMCMNRRYTGIRHVAMLYLASTKNFFSGNYSWNVFTSFAHVGGKLWFDFGKWKFEQAETWNRLHSGLDVLNEVIPLGIDSDKPNVYHIGDPNRKDPDLIDNKLPRFKYAESFCTIVTETRFAEPTANFSEKVTNTMKCYRPFVLVGPPRTLEYLKILGFKTFGEFWDESYDQELDHEKRLLMIFKLIDYIDTLTWYDQKTILEKMQPIFEHNAKILKDLAENFPTIPY